MSRPLYDRIRDPDPYVRLFALLEVARMRERAKLADDLALHLHVLVSEIEAGPPVERVGDAISKSRAVLARYIKLNEEV